MVEVPVYNMAGKQIETLEVDEERFGSRVNTALLKQAVVAYHTNTHQGSAATRSRGMVAGSGRKMFRQKGTGNARRGNSRTNILRGGGVAFAKKPHRDRHRLSQVVRRKALDSAILAKLLGADLMVVDGLKLDTPKTKTIVQMLGKLKVDRSCLLTLGEPNDVVYRSARNIPRLAVRVVADLSAFEVAERQKMVLTRDAMTVLLEGGKSS